VLASPAEELHRVAEEVMGKAAPPAGAWAQLLEVVLPKLGEPRVMYSPNG
jgi:hypothetical protein